MKSGMSLNRLEVFLKIVEAGSISKAAEVLREPKSKVSRDLALLEAELKVQLIYRTTRKFQLTEAGQKLYQNSRLLLSQLKETVAEITQQDEVLSGTIRLTAPEDIGTYVVTGIIDEFLLQHPGIKMELIYSNQILDLVQQRVDVAVRIGRLSDSSLVARKAGGVDMLLMASPKYLDSLERIPTLEDLAAGRINSGKIKTVYFMTKDLKPQWSLVCGKERKTIRVSPDLFANNLIALRDLVVKGYGIGFLPRHLCQEALAKGQLVHILKSWSSERQPVQVVVPSQKEMPLRIRKISDLLVKRLSERFG